MKPPFSWEQNIESQCEPKMLSIGDSFFTSTLGFRYTVKSLKRLDETLSSIPYLGDTLEDCFLDRVLIKLSKSDTAAFPTFWISWSPESSVEATAACSVMTQHGRANISLALQYSGGTDRTYEYILDDDPEKHASVWWGTRLLNAYLAAIWQIMSLTQQVSAEAEDRDHYWASGNIAYSRDSSEQEYVKGR